MTDEAEAARLRDVRDELQSLLDIPPRPKRRPYLQGLHGRAVVERAVAVIDTALARALSTGEPRELPAGYDWGALLEPATPQVGEPSPESAALPEGFERSAAITRAYDALPEGCTIISTAKLAALTARVEAAEQALTEAADVFDSYAALHDAKGSDDGRRKAAANREHAAMCRAALLPSGDTGTAREQQEQDQG